MDAHHLHTRPAENTLEGREKNRKLQLLPKAGKSWETKQVKQLSPAGIQTTAEARLGNVPLPTLHKRMMLMRSTFLNLL